MRAATPSTTRPARAYVDDTVLPSGPTASQIPKTRPRVTVITDHSAGFATTRRGGGSRTEETTTGRGGGCRAGEATTRRDLRPLGGKITAEPGEARAGGATRRERSGRELQTANSSRTSLVRLCSNQNDKNGIVPASAVARVREAFHRALIARSRVMNRYRM